MASEFRVEVPGLGLMMGTGINGGEAPESAPVARPRISRAELEERRRQALQRAEQGRSVRNELAVIAAFRERGIPESEILPRVNVFTFGAWIAKGRQVRKGEKSVRIAVWVPAGGEDENGEARLICKTAHVFHVSQTVPR